VFASIQKQWLSWSGRGLQRVLQIFAYIIIKPVSPKPPRASWHQSTFVCRQWSERGTRHPSSTCA